MNRAWKPPFRYVVIAALVAVLLWALWFLRELYRPLIISALLAFFLSPAVNFLISRTRLTRRSAANLVYFAAVLVFVALLFTVVPALIEEFNTVDADFNHAMDGLQLILNQFRQVGGINLYLDSVILAMRGVFSGAFSFAPQPLDALRLVQSTSRGFLWSLVVIVTTYYFLTEWSALRGWLIHLAPEDEQADLLRLYQEIRSVWMSYLRGQLRLIVILAAIYTAAWLVIGLPGAPALGVLAGLLNLLPEVGPAGAALLATVVAFLEGSTRLPLPNVWFALLTLGLYCIINSIKTIWLQPRILGQSVLLHEAIVFVAIIAALIMQGVLGVLLVVPLLASLGVVGRYLRGRLLGQPPFAGPAPAAPARAEPDPPPSGRPARKAVRGKNQK